jgi:DNA-nicking Smr family endonuclease
MARRSKLAPEDRELFRREVGPVKRLYHDRVEPLCNPIAPIPHSTLSDERQVLVDMVSDYFEPAELDTGELRRGQFRVSAVLDLHGMTVTMARHALITFIHTARRDNMTCVRIIHGKGNGSRHKGPVLKQKVNHWLRQRDDILAFCSSRPIDGGTGAVYVLLRRRP